MRWLSLLLTSVCSCATFSGQAQEKFEKCLSNGVSYSECYQVAQDNESRQEEKEAEESEKQKAWLDENVPQECRTDWTDTVMAGLSIYTLFKSKKVKPADIASVTKGGIELLSGLKDTPECRSALAALKSKKDEQQAKKEKDEARKDIEQERKERLELLRLLKEQKKVGCTIDNDCKGDRICEKGNCVSPK